MKIELAALELFLARGIDAVNVSEIGAAAGISRRTFYRYFETVDDILVAMPLRSLRRMAEDMADRPRHEGVREALVNASRAADFSEEDKQSHRLAAKVAKQCPDAFWRAMGRMQPTAGEAYAEMIAARLRLRGEDDSAAPLIAAVILTAIQEICRDFDGETAFRPDPDAIDEALGQLARHFTI